MKFASFLFRQSMIALLATIAFSINACDQLNLEDCFEPLNGSWVRINSNASQNDCMKVVISGEVAVLFANPKNVSWVDEGDNLWQSITHVQAFSEYELEVLGSDGQYYNATLKLDDPNTISIVVDAGGSSGTEQEWVRVGASEILPECEVSDINGNWTRTESNASHNDGMRVRLDEDQAVLTFAPSSSTDFNVDDVLWKEITSIPGGDTFSLKVLGSDGQYYDASLKRISGQKLELSIGNSGSGNTQVWER